MRRAAIALRARNPSRDSNRDRGTGSEAPTIKARFCCPIAHHVQRRLRLPIARLGEIASS